MSKFAEGTKVRPEKSRMEIEQVLKRYGATGFGSAWDEAGARIMFAAHGRRVRFAIPMPPLHNMKPKKGSEPPRWLYWDADRRAKWCEDKRELEVRRRWRALLLVIKAKLEVVQSEISTFESEFLAHIVLPNGQTVGDTLTPQLDTTYKTGKMPPMLGAGESQ